MWSGFIRQNEEALRRVQGERLGKDMTKRQKKSLTRIIIAAVLMIILKFLPVEGWLKFVLYMVPYLVVGYDILRKAFKGILNKQVFDENFLMAVATIGAIALGNYKEGVSVMLFYQIGELFQSYAVGKSRRNISDLMDIRPDYANIEKDGELEQVDPDEVEVGTIIVVQPGEKVPIDGVIEEGSSTLNTSALTGESVPREAAAGDEVISGCINLTGLLKIRTTKEFGESTVSKILDLVENSSSKKSRSENFISKFARYYTPAVCYGALALAILPPLVRMFAFALAPEWGDWIYRALTFLVISCPCALVISIPLSFFAGIGGASHEGVLVKGSNYLETMAQTKYVVFDKTGTMTQGVFEVNGVHHNTMPEEQLLEYAALAECSSSHPISKSLQKAYGKQINRDRVTEIEELSGKGVTAKVDGIPVAAGNAKLMKYLNVEYSECEEVGTIVHVAVNGKYAGHILISDKLKPHAKEAIRDLKKAGITKTVMLTGDMKRVADKVAEELGIGRNSTREALSILHGMGMIERVQGSGNYISKDAGGSIHRILRMMLALGTITGQEIEEFRCMMEKAVCLDLLERGLSEEQQTYFEKLLQGMEAAFTEEFLELDKTFHEQLICATGNPLFILLLESVSKMYQEQIACVLQQADENGRGELLTQHRAIYNHLMQKDKEAMLEAIDRHYIR